MSEEKELFDLIRACLKKNREKLQYPIRQKAKFEGWLKIELFYSIWDKLLDRNQDSEIELERSYHHNTKCHCDIFFCTPKKKHVYLELKTINTNYDCNSNLIMKKTKPITKNVRSVIEDAKKLRKIKNKKAKRVVAFVVYPLCKGELKEWNYHESKINRHRFLKKIDSDDLPVFSHNKRIFMRLYLYRVT